MKITEGKSIDSEPTPLPKTDPIQKDKKVIDVYLGRPEEWLWVTY